MSEEKVEGLFYENLRFAVEQQGRPSPVEALATSQWVAMSALQKAIRRGRVDVARSAAATLLKEAPDRLWRRLACIAAEDIGLGSPKAMGIATAALAGKRVRAELGGEWPVACAVIAALAEAPKCRAADDLLMSCGLHPVIKAHCASYSTLTLPELMDIVFGDGAIVWRAPALAMALTGTPKGDKRPRPRRDTEPVFDRLIEGGCPEGLVELARLNFNRTGVMLAPLVALLARELPADATIEPETAPPEVMVEDVPGWAFDVYSHEGRHALGRFLEGYSDTAMWVREFAPYGQGLAIFAHAVFRIEGGVVDRRLRWRLSDQLREDVDLGCGRLSPDQARELLPLARADIPELNRTRAGVFKIML